jgi:predicted XRE-type DNA-binding protein
MRRAKTIGNAMRKKRRRRKMDVDVEVSSGNVFADLGLPDAGELDIKLRLAVEIVRVIEARRLSQVAAADLLGINQPKVSALKNYKLDGFSVERLLTFLLALGKEVEIRIRPWRASKGRNRILVAAVDW